MYMMISLSLINLYILLMVFLVSKTACPACFCLLAWPKTTDVSILLFVVLYRVENIQNHIGRRHFHKK